MMRAALEAGAALLLLAGSILVLNAIGAWEQVAKWWNREGEE